MILVLDTHILIQAAAGSLAKARAEILSDARNKLRYSAISLWKIAKLCEHGRIRPAGGLRAFLDSVHSHPRYEAVPLIPEVLACATERVAPNLHKDPADQLIVASALVLSAKLMTDDRLIERSGLVETI